MNIIGLAGAAQSGKNTISDYLATRYGYVQFAFSDALYAEVAAGYNMPDESFLRGGFKEIENYAMTLNHCNDKGFIDVAVYELKKAGIGFPKQMALSPRWILQVWGTEYRRAQDKDYWIKKADLFLEAYINNLKHTVTQEDHETLINEFINEAPDGLTVSREHAAGYVAPVGQEYYTQHPGIAVDGVRFENEYDWVKNLSGQIWHVRRQVNSKINGIPTHASEDGFPLRTGDKLILNYSTIERLHTGVTLAIQGNDIVNTDWGKDDQTSTV